VIGGVARRLQDDAQHDGGRYGTSRDGESAAKSGGAKSHEYKGQYAKQQQGPAIER
jgi:hypothetical protein